jgi:hypothetical protein
VLLRSFFAYGRCDTFEVNARSQCNEVWQMAGREICRRRKTIIHTNIGLHSSSLPKLSVAYRARCPVVTFFLKKKVTKNSRLCQNPTILLEISGGSGKNSPVKVVWPNGF